ncbi:MAG: class I SAM-dependent RNA methyltransferase [Snowella sp.]|nr:class I SAM-dependent RNA methyltransferase [Snowella sp.]
MGVYQHYFATVARGLEDLAAQELTRLGAINAKPEFTGVSFQGTQETLYRINLWSRMIFRVLVPLATVKSRDAEQLYKGVQSINWLDYLQLDQAFAVNCTGGNRQLNHSHFTALQVKNAIVDQQRAQTGKRSDIDVNHPDIVVNVHIYQDNCVISLDSSGFSLHRRGYRPAMGLAPLKETLAAALLAIAEWTPDRPFLDPLCGSGTLPIEAALMALNVAPGLYNSFAFQNWPDFNPTLWEQLQTEAEQGVLSELPSLVWGSDGDETIISQARANAKASGLEQHLYFQHKQLSEVEAPADQGIIICNPPYGVRIGEEQELGALYKLLGDIFKQRFKGWTAYVLTGNKELAKRIGLKASRRFPVFNGSLPCTLLKYELY